MSISNGLNKQPSTSEVVTERRSAKGVFCSVKKLFQALLNIPISRMAFLKITKPNFKKD